MIAFAQCQNRPAAFAKETNDCTVRALMTCTGIEYAASHAILRAGGRLNRKGPSWGQWRCILAKQDFSEVSGIPKRCTLSYTLSRLPKQGRFICDVRGHTFAIIDGVVHDWKPGARRRVWAVWKFNGSAKQKPAQAQPTAPPVLADAIRWEAVWNGRL